MSKRLRCRSRHERVKLQDTDLTDSPSPDGHVGGVGGPEQQCARKPTDVPVCGHSGPGRPRSQETEPSPSSRTSEKSDDKSLYRGNFIVVPKSPTEDTEKVHAHVFRFPPVRKVRPGKQT